MIVPSSQAPRCSVFAAALVAAACLAPARPALGQDWSAMEQQVARARARQTPGSVRKLSAEDEPEYGTQDETVVAVDAYAFQGAQSGDHLNDDGNGYRHLEASASGYLAASVSLPGGVMIESLGINACSTTGDLAISLYDGNFSGQPIVLIDTLTTFSTGCSAYAHFPSPGTLYQNPRLHPLYLVIHWEGPTDGSLKFNSASVGFKRVVSPAPAMATFNDVATGDPFFQFIEALAASGITAGCGNGNFCPNAPLTRGQMAVFLSKALGLHWQDAS
ncbi:MAG TPA: S-layer homology domain-containing protein [Thermoanaerobaculia bacterium]|nr:S-layer homology domain-containing protein [Thermoanaerobaculia bacterium]